MEYSLSIHYADIFVMLGVGLLTLWLVLAGYIRDLSARAMFTLTGHFRARPDPWLEGALRTAFTEFDRELAMILRDRSCPHPPLADRTARLSRTAAPQPLAGPAGPPSGGTAA